MRQTARVDCLERPESMFNIFQPILVVKTVFTNHKLKAHLLYGYCMYVGLRVCSNILIYTQII